MARCRRKLEAAVREESSLAAPKQHYAGHPEPTNGSASIAADINGEHRIKISEKSPHMRGLQGRPDTQDGLAQRSDHVDLVAAAPHSEPRNTYGQAATKVASQRSQPQPRDTHYPPAGVVANPRRDPPAGYFGTHSRRDQLTAHTAHVQVQGRPYGKAHPPAQLHQPRDSFAQAYLFGAGGGRVFHPDAANLPPQTTPAAPIEAGQVVAYRAHGSGVKALRQRDPAAHPNAESAPQEVGASPSQALQPRCSDAEMAAPACAGGLCLHARGSRAARGGRAGCR